MTVIWGGPLLRILRHFRMGKIIRVEEPSQHAVKMGTPTMGGVMFILPVLLLTVLLNAVALIGMRGERRGPLSAGADDGDGGLRQSSGRWTTGRAFAASARARA